MWNGLLQTIHAARVYRQFQDIFYYQMGGITSLVTVCQFFIHSFVELVVGRVGWWIDADRRTDRQTARERKRQTDGRTDRRTDRQTDRQLVRQTGRNTDSRSTQPDRQSEKETDRQSDR